MINETLIRKIHVRRLHGEKDIVLPIFNNCVIIVGDNGFGKTSLLNILYGIFNKDLKYLLDINFESISFEIEFTNSCYKVPWKYSIPDYIPNLAFNYVMGEKQLKIFNFLKDDLVSLYELKNANKQRRNNSPFKVSSRLDNKFLKNLESSYDLFDDDSSTIWNKFSNAQIKRIVNSIVGLSDESIEALLSKNKEFYELNQKLMQPALTFQTLFLPTYRRIEQKSEYFGLEDVKDTSINFGMEDVKLAIKNITDEIIQASVDWVSKVNGRIIDEILNIDETQANFNNSDFKSIEKTLLRIDDKYLNPSSKQKIFNLIDTNQISENTTLIYYLKNMLKLHEEQNEKDNKLKQFAETCNKYLRNKRIIYDEFKVKLSVLKNTGEEIDFSLLSSGEKQIIAIFTRLILTNNKNIAIIFDEPEISISIEWQEMILQDIYNIPSCKFLIAATHSPFVFDNSLRKYVVDIEYTSQDSENING